MSGLSLREQLLQAGLVSEKQVKQAEQSHKRQTFTDRKQVGKKDRNFREEQRQAELQKQAAAKAAKDAELNRKREEKAAAKARWAEIRQLVEQHAVARPETLAFTGWLRSQTGRADDRSRTARTPRR